MLGTAPPLGPCRIVDDRGALLLLWGMLTLRAEGLAPARAVPVPPPPPPLLARAETVLSARLKGAAVVGEVATARREGLVDGGGTGERAAGPRALVGLRALLMAAVAYDDALLFARLSGAAPPPVVGLVVVAVRGDGTALAPRPVAEAPPLAEAEPEEAAAGPRAGDTDEPEARPPPVAGRADGARGGDDDDE